MKFSTIFRNLKISHKIYIIITIGCINLIIVYLLSTYLMKTLNIVTRLGMCEHRYANEVYSSQVSFEKFSRNGKISDFNDFDKSLDIVYRYTYFFGQLDKKNKTSSSKALIKEAADIYEELEGVQNAALMINRVKLLLFIDLNLVHELIALPKKASEMGKIIQSLVGDYANLDDIQKLDAYEEIESQYEIMLDMGNQFSQKIVELTEFVRVLAKTAMIIIILGAVTLTLVISIVTSRTITRPLPDLLGFINRISEGDLSHKSDIMTKDEIGEIARYFNTLVTKLNETISNVKNSTKEVSTASNEISSTSGQLAKGVEEQSSQASEVAASVQEMTAAILQNSQNATHTAQIAEKATVKAREGADAMQATKSGMDAIVRSAETTGEIIQSLSNRANQIDEITRVIDEIADQTNLLALNAAIEAARAGEQGRGFSVVADEVRKLAERTTKATGEIGETIGGIQSDTKKAAEAMEEAAQVVESGRQATAQTEEVLGEIMQAVSTAMDMVNQIATATEEMSSGAEEISKNVDHINNVTKESANGAEVMANTADILNRQSEALNVQIKYFRLQES